MTCVSAESEKSFYFSDLLLIQEVEKNPILWDARVKGYRNEKAKAAIFRSIADKLGKHGKLLIGSHLFSSVITKNIVDHIFF